MSRPDILSQELQRAPIPENGDLSLLRRPWNTTEGLLEPPRPFFTRESSISELSTGSASGNSFHIIKYRNRPPKNGKRRRPWTTHKIWLLMSNTLIFFYGLGLFVAGVLTYYEFYYYAKVVVVGEGLNLGLATASGAACIITAFIGYTGIMLNHRGILTIYNLFLWPCFALIACIGYFAYRKALPSRPGVLYQRISQSWHVFFTNADRSTIQTFLHCCGFKQFADFPVRGGGCFPNTLKPGCSNKYHNLTVKILEVFYITAFTLVPVHIFVIASALTCSNHVNRQFGKGLPPKMYRLENQSALIAKSAMPISLSMSTTLNKLT